VELVRRGYEAYARGDLEAVLGDFSPDLVTFRSDPDGATSTAARVFWRRSRSGSRTSRSSTSRRSSSPMPATTACSFTCDSGPSEPRAAPRSKASSGSSTRSGTARSCGSTCSSRSDRPGRPPASGAKRRGSEPGGETEACRPRAGGRWRQGIGLVGALAVLEERGYVPQNVAGTSAGAIAAALIAAGYSAGALATWWMPSSPTSPATATASR
jgi:hypothetical protein